MQRGTKKVQNQTVLTKDLTAANCMSESTNRTLACLRKMKSSKLPFADLDSEDCIDLLCHKRLSDLMESSQSDITPPYIQYIRADSFMVAWWCQTQIEYFAQGKTKVLHFDATGNISRSIFDGGRRQFYYSAVYRNPISGEITPVFQCISAFHDVASLLAPFKIFSRKLKLVSTKSLKTITTDFSFALMQTVCQSFNDCNLYCYLLMLHSQITEKKFLAKNLSE